ncbi:DEAD/DEAH box helicase [Bacillus suaedaesalsae]|uniref:DEAD/DEAH box helicase n=1 Tax=Bacillus suaedaesalsae TaxID=2810349 RepID=A0ABS2DNZ7_9BACI|nr:DEAD/DEAH box helicase [Bacillus suaedaesalsae]MBM6619333.1 DEAD/DEAH box helicase [Bacillus suaedaesalsae]
MEFSINEFKGFIKDAWVGAGFTTFTDVQKQSIPKMMNKEDIIVESPPGTGKTLAYLLPILQSLQEDTKSPQAVIIAPTRELVMQIHDEATRFLKGSPFSSATFIGGADLKRQVEKLKKHPQIIVGSPHRLVELIEMKKLKMHEVKTIVIDEADQLVGSGVTKEMDRIVQSALRDRQLVAFSATLPPNTVELLQMKMNNPKKVQIQTAVEARENTQFYYVVCERRDKIDYLRRILHTEPNIKAIAFINDSFHLEALASKMKYKKIEAGVLYSQSTQAEREATLKKFRLGKYQLLLATDVAARGLDIQGITHVVHLDIPDQIEPFVHRSGRTGRMGAKGTVVALATPYEENVLQNYDRRLNLSLKKMDLHRGQWTDQKPVYEKKKPMQVSKGKPNSKSFSKNKNKK